MIDLRKLRPPDKIRLKDPVQSSEILKYCKSLRKIDTSRSSTRDVQDAGANEAGGITSHSHICPMCPQYFYSSLSAMH